MNSTETFWSADGVSLQTYATNIATLGGDRLAPPPLRGDDIVVPYRPGSVYVPKVVDKRIITLGMWVIGANPDGSIPTNESGRRTFDRNWRALVKLLWTPRKQITLTKRFWVPTADLVAGGMSLVGLPQDGLWTLIEATAKASFAGGLVPTMGGPSRAAFTIDLLLCDPYFYGTALTVPFSTSVVAPAPGPLRTIQVLGDDRTTAISFAFSGPLTSPKFTLTNYENAPWFRYATLIAAGDSATVDVKAFSAKHTASLTTYASSGNAQHYGDRFWFFLDPGSSALALSVQEGTGTGTLTYSPVYL